MDLYLFAIDSTAFTTILVFLVTFLVVLYSTTRRHGDPPGPQLLPVIGNIHLLVSGNIFDTFRGLRQKYGNIYSLYMGTHLMVVLNGYDVIHEALVKNGKLFSHRPWTHFQTVGIDYRGPIMSNGNPWKEQRRFTQDALQQICFKNRGQYFESVINDELSSIVDKLDQVAMETSVYDIENDLLVSVTNIISRVLFNHRFDFNDSGLHEQQERVKAVTGDFIKMKVMFDLFPFLKMLPQKFLNSKSALDVFNKMIAFQKPNLDRIKVSDEPADHRTVASLFFERLEERESSGTEAEDSTFNETQLQHTVYDLVNAGSETTANTIRWILVHVIRNPDVQDKMFEEISRVLGDRRPTIADRKELPYIESVILEGLRIDPVVPLSLPHAVSHDTVFHGFVIPKDCSVTLNLHSLLKDPDVWQHPDEFRPERFLNETGSEVTQVRELVPFSLGPRACLGETLARTELFLYVAGLFQRFKFLPEQDDELPSLQGKLTDTWRVDPFKMRVVARCTIASEIIVQVPAQTRWQIVPSIHLVCNLD